jgi:ATP-binding cassette subfamily F protein uup
VVFGYFSQQGLEPEIDKRVIDLVKDIAEEIALENGSMSAGQFLYPFGFSKEMQYTPYSMLSGGRNVSSTF